MPPIEPWLRGPLPGTNPLVANLYYTFTQVREELGKALEALSSEQIWRRPYGLPAIGFHVRHLGGAAERLGCYLAGKQLTAEQLAELRQESEPGASASELLAELDSRLGHIETFIKGLDGAVLVEPREVGRGRLPTTAIGLIVHIAEHSQRHLGQAITMARMVRSMDQPPPPESL